VAGFTGKPKTMKEINIALIKNELKKIGAATRAELSEITGISQTTVRSLLEELLQNNEVIRLGLDKSSGGRRAERYALNLEESLALAFYIRDNFIEYVISNPLREIIEDARVEIGSTDYLYEIEKILDDIIKSKTNIKAIGIAVPGVVDIEKRKYLFGKNLKGWEESNIGEYIEEKYDIPVILENDLNAMAFGHSIYLMDRLDVDDLHILNMIYIHFTKSGAGSGIILNGELVHGGSNLAGEIGFIPLGDGQYLNSFIESEPEDYSYIDTVSRVIATTNCMINPDLVVVGGETFRENLINPIIEKCETYIANKVMPEILIAEDSRRDCLTGIIELTIKLMYSGVKLVDNTKRNINRV